jgi:hypothetical protein
MQYVMVPRCLAHFVEKENISAPDETPAVAGSCYTAHSDGFSGRAACGSGLRRRQHARLDHLLIGVQRGVLPGGWRNRGPPPLGTPAVAAPHVPGPHLATPGLHSELKPRFVRLLLPQLAIALASHCQSLHHHVLGARDRLGQADDPARPYNRG